MEITVLFFGELAEVAETKKLILTNLYDTAALNEHLLLSYPDLKDKTFRIALNQELVNEKRMLFCPPTQEDKLIQKITGVSKWLF